MTAIAKAFRQRAPYLWRLRPFAAFGGTAALLVLLPLTAPWLGDWSFSELEGLEQVQGRLLWYELTLTSIVVLALAAWAWRLLQFPLYAARPWQIAATIGFYWLVVFCALLAPRLAIDRTLVQAHAGFPEAAAAATDLEQLRALCDPAGPGLGRADAAAILDRHYGEGYADERLAGVGLLTVSRSRFLRSGRWELGLISGSDETAPRESGWGSGFEAALSRLLSLCGHEHRNALYNVEEVSLLVLEDQGRSPRASFYMTARLIGGLNVVVALHDHAQGTSGPFSRHRATPDSGYVALSLAVACLLYWLTEHFGRGGARALRLPGMPRRPRPVMGAGRFARRWPRAWSLGLDRVATSLLAAFVVAFVVSFALDLVHLPWLFTEDDGRPSGRVQDDAADALAALISLLVIIAAIFRHPVERTRFDAVTANLVLGISTILHYAAITLAVWIGSFAAHDVWSSTLGRSAAEASPWTWQFAGQFFGDQLDALLLLTIYASFLAPVRYYLLLKNLASGWFAIGAYLLLTLWAIGIIASNADSGGITVVFLLFLLLMSATIAAQHLLRIRRAFVQSLVLIIVVTCCWPIAFAAWKALGLDLDHDWAPVALPATLIIALIPWSIALRRASRSLDEPG